ncbi:hypothetical protein JHK87_027722 [Glycine soja]|nr:hypothetical protein JHK87_027722 [Glycine soja]
MHVALLEGALQPQTSVELQTSLWGSLILEMDIIAYHLYVYCLIGDVIAANSSHREFFHVWKTYGVLPERILANRKFFVPLKEMKIRYIILWKRVQKLRIKYANLSKYCQALVYNRRSPIFSFDLMNLEVGFLVGCL